MYDQKIIITKKTWRIIIHLCRIVIKLFQLWRIVIVAFVFMCLCRAFFS